MAHLSSMSKASASRREAALQYGPPIGDLAGYTPTAIADRLALALQDPECNPSPRDFKIVPTKGSDNSKLSDDPFVVFQWQAVVASFGADQCNLTEAYNTKYGLTPGTAGAADDDGYLPAALNAAGQCWIVTHRAEIASSVNAARSTVALIFAGDLEARVMACRNLVELLPALRQACGAFPMRRVGILMENFAAFAPAPGLRPGEALTAYRERMRRITDYVTNTPGIEWEHVARHRLERVTRLHLEAMPGYEGSGCAMQLRDLDLSRGSMDPADVLADMRLEFAPLQRDLDHLHLMSAGDVKRKEPSPRPQPLRSAALQAGALPKDSAYEALPPNSASPARLSSSSLTEAIQEFTSANDNVQLARFVYHLARSGDLGNLAPGIEAFRSASPAERIAHFVTVCHADYRGDQSPSRPAAGEPTSAASFAVPFAW